MRTVNYRLHNKLEEVFTIPPNDLGNDFLTQAYHRLTIRLKKLPFIFILPISLTGAILIYLVFGLLIVKVVSLLQYGF